METILKIRDEYFGTDKSEDPPAFDLRLISASTTPAEIIRQRVEDEVDAVNAGNIAEVRTANALIERVFQRHERTRSFLIDVEQGSAEDQLNTPRSFRSLKAKLRKPAKLIEADVEVEKALDAFRQNRIVMLFDDRQVDGLEMPLTVTPDSQVTFIHLMPLKGG